MTTFVGHVTKLGGHVTTFAGHVTTFVGHVTNLNFRIWSCAFMYSYSCLHVRSIIRYVHVWS